MILQETLLSILRANTSIKRLYQPIRLITYKGASTNLDVCYQSQVSLDHLRFQYWSFPLVFSFLFHLIFFHMQYVLHICTLIFSSTRSSRAQTFKKLKNRKSSSTALFSNMCIQDPWCSPEVPREERRSSCRIDKTFLYLCMLCFVFVFAKREAKGSMTDNLSTSGFSHYHTVFKMCVHVL